MAKYNLNPGPNIDNNYLHGLLPQRNKSEIWYSDTSSRSNLTNLQLNSENRRIISKTNQFIHKKILLKEFSFTPEIQKTIYSWIKQLEWNFPISSVKTIFNNHIFNYLYIWKDQNNQVAAYSICYFSNSISHIAYVFYNPQYSHDNLPIRLVLQVITDSYDKNLKFCYLGRFSPDNGYYKRNMPGFEYFQEGNWIKYEK
jgi:arginyl-tRNA--protein-N-Asp/Glu arginylyltransferase